MSLEQITPLLMNTVAGAATGYITNDYAVKMLFRKYGPFGGVLLATKEEFVQSMSDLVEREIINAQTLSSSLAHQDTQNVLRKIIHDTTKKYLYNNTTDIPLQSMDGAGKTIDNFLLSYQQYSPELVQNLWATFLQNTTIKNLLPVKQQEFLSNKLFQLLFNELKKSFAAEKLVQNFYAQNQEKKLRELIPAEVFLQLTENLSKHFHNNQEKSADFINFSIDSGNLQEIFQTINLKKLWANFIGQISQKNLFEIFGEDNLSNIWQEFVVHIYETLQSDAGQTLIASAVDNIFIALKNIEVSLFDLLEAGLQIKISNFLQEHLPSLIENIILWFQENKNALEELINSAIDEVLNKEQQDIFGKAKKFLKDAMYENVAGKQELIAKMIYALQNDLDIKNVSEEISAYIIQYLQKTSVSEIISKLETNGIITKTDFVKLINRLAKNYAENPDLQLIAPWVECKVHEIFDFASEETLYQHFENFCTQQLRNYSWQNNLLKELATLPEKNLATICSVEQMQALGKNGQTFLLEQLYKNKTSCTQNLSAIITKSIAEKNLAAIVSTDFSQTSTENIVLNSTKYLTEFLHSPELGTVYELLDKLNQNEKFGKLAPALSIKLLQRNFDTLLTGNISTAVKNNLSALPDQELQNIVENFMGKELGPINTIGAVMGAVAGASCYALGLGNLSPTFWLSTLSSGAVFGLIGYTTNVLAIKMIFRPYKKWQIKNITIPCTPGIIAKQKPRFAISMAEFIDESLLNKDKLQEYFQDKRSGMENSLYDLFAQDNFQLFQDFMQSNLARLSKQILSLTENSLHNKKSLLSTKLQKILQERDLSQQNFLMLEKFMYEQSSNLFPCAEKFGAEKLQTIFAQQITMQDFIADDYKTKLVHNILRNKIQEFASLITDPTQLEVRCKKYQPHFAKLLAKPLKNLFPKEGYLDFKQDLQNHLQENLQTATTQQRLAKLLEEKLFGELKTNKTVGELFSGKLLTLLQDNSPVLLKFITERGVSILQGKRADLKTTISQKAEQEHSFLFHALDVGSTISAIVDNFLDVKIPSFVAEKEADLSKFILTFINNDLSNFSSKELGLILEQKSLAKIIAQLANSPNMQSFLDITVAIILDLIFARPVQEILRVTNLQSLSDIYQHLAPELKTLQNHLAQNILQQEDELVENLQPLVLNILAKNILSISLPDLTAGIHPSTIEKSCHNILRCIEESTYWENILAEYLHACRQTLQQEKLGDLLDVELLSTTIIIAIENLFADPATKKILGEILSNTLNKIDFDKVLATESKEYLAKVISKSFLDALSSNFLELLLAMKIKEISHEQIDAMSPEEIEKMFYSFAAPYFSKVEMYGGAAAIFGMALAPLLK